VRVLHRPILSCIIANFLALLLIAAPACSARFDTDNLGADASQGSSTDGGSDDDGGDDDGTGGDGTGDGGIPGGDAGEQDGGGDDGSDDDGGDDDGEPDAGDDDGPEPDAGDGECGGVGQPCCEPMNADSCTAGDFVECTGPGGTCQPCGQELGEACCETAPRCDSILGAVTCELGICDSLL
jgi:hypothetical protein